MRALLPVAEHILYLVEYLDNVYNDLGTSSSIFNAGDGTTALTFSIKKDISLMYYWSKQYELAINAFLRRKAKNDQLYFSIKFLPTSSIFRKEDVDMYLKTAQYGYPRSTVSAVMGLDMVDLAQVTDFENNVLHLEKSMIQYPLFTGSRVLVNVKTNKMFSKPDSCICCL